MGGERPLAVLVASLMDRLAASSAAFGPPDARVAIAPSVTVVTIAIALGGGTTCGAARRRRWRGRHE